MLASFCGNCGRSFQPNETFCAQCGTPRDSSVSDTTTVFVSAPSARSSEASELGVKGVLNTVSPSALRPEALAKALPVKGSRVRRFVLLGLVGLVIVALGSGIAWFTLSHPSPTGGTPTTPTGVIT